MIFSIGDKVVTTENCFQKGLIGTIRSIIPMGNNPRYGVEFDIKLRGMNNLQNLLPENKGLFLSSMSLKKFEKKDDIKKLKRISHIIKELYKIKNIDRTKDYKSSELLFKIKQNKHGRKVISELKKEGVTQTFLRKYKMNKLSEILLHELLP